jgi:hypothetical protein
METGNKSEVAQLLRRIELEYEAAQRALTGLASGNARHEFITAKMERMQQCQEQLGQLIGEREATVLVAQLLEAKPE